jgi:hypothetical protein
MQQGPENCPRCNALHSFAPFTEDNEHGFQEVIIRCPTCRWRIIIGYTTPMLTAAKKRMRRYQILHDYQAGRYGHAAASTIERLREAHQHVIALERTLMEEVTSVAAQEADRRPA